MLLRDVAASAGIVAAVITDSGHVMAGTPFDGTPIVTALGLGPATREEVRHIVQRLPLVR